MALTYATIPYNLVKHFDAILTIIRCLCVAIIAVHLFKVTPDPILVWWVHA